MKTSFSSDRTCQRPFSAERRPDFFIVGAPKCGTSAMAHYLAAHPAVFMARKEMHFFGADLRFGRQFYRRNLAEYVSEFDAWNGQPRAGEASVWYLKSSQAAAEIKAFNPQSRIIVMLRAPDELLHSLFFQFRCDGNEHLRTFGEALAAEEDRRAGRRVSRRTYLAQGLIYREVIRFTEQVERYFKAFGRHRVHVIIYDDFAANPGEVYRQTLRFLEVDPALGESQFDVVNSSKMARSQALLSALNDPMARSTALALRAWLPRPLFAGLRRLESQIRNVNSRASRRPPLDHELRAMLKRESAPEIERLSLLLGRDLTHWSRTDVAAANPISKVVIARHEHISAEAPDDLDQPILA